MGTLQNDVNHVNPGVPRSLKGQPSQDSSECFILQSTGDRLHESKEKGVGKSSRTSNQQAQGTWVCVGSRERRKGQGPERHAELMMKPETARGFTGLARCVESELQPDASTS